MLDDRSDASLSVQDARVSIDADKAVDHPPDVAGAVAIARAADDDIDRLAAELAPILVRKPRRLEAAHPSAASEPDVDETLALRPAGRRAFTSALRHDDNLTYDAAGADDTAETNGDSEDTDHPGPAGSNRWLKRARRQRILGGLRHAGAWVATVAIGSAIVVAAAFAVFATSKDLDAWREYGARALRTSAAESAVQRATENTAVNPAPKPQGRL